MRSNRSTRSVSAKEESSAGPSGSPQATTSSKARSSSSSATNVGIPDSILNGPVLADAPYPDVLVARAHSDGSDLDLTLAPGATGGQVELGLGQLRPGRTYNVSGTDQRLTADPHGRATLPIHLHTRTHIHIAPEV